MMLKLENRRKSECNRPLFIPESPPVILEMSTGKQMDQMLDKCKIIIPALSLNLKIAFDDDSLGAIMETAKKEKENSAKIPDVFTEVKKKADDGSVVLDKEFSMCHFQ